MMMIKRVGNSTAKNLKKQHLRILKERLNIEITTFMVYNIIILYCIIVLDVSSLLPALCKMKLCPHNLGVIRRTLSSNNVQLILLHAGEPIIIKNVVIQYGDIFQLYNIYIILPSYCSYLQFKA